MSLSLSKTPYTDDGSGRDVVTANLPVKPRRKARPVGNVASFGEVNDSVRDIADGRDGAHRRKRLQEILRFVRMHWSVHNAGRDGVEANVFFRVLDR
jgi:hypothetical protein